MMKEWGYNHFCQTDPKLKAILETRFPRYGGICWFACLVMAVEAALSKLGIEYEEVLMRLIRATLKTNLEELEEVVYAISEAGADVAPIRRRGHAVFLSNQTGGGGDVQFIRENPELFGIYLAELLQSLGGLPVEVRVVAYPEDDSPCNIWWSIKTHAEQGWASTLALRVRKGERQSNHAVFLGGVGENVYVISDPNLRKPIPIHRAMFEEACADWVAVGKNLDMRFNGLVLGVRYAREHRDLLDLVPV
jgi:hypothetical protein